MADASERHDTIALNLASACHAVGKGGKCRTFMSDMRLRLDAGSAYDDPDAMVVCDALDNDPMFKTAPWLIAEVMSPVTEAIDRCEKLAAYRRVSPRQWGVSALGAGDAPASTCLPLTLPVAEIHRGIDFDS